MQIPTLRMPPVGHRRWIEGWASTPRTNAYGESYAPFGATVSLPIPLLLEHKAKQVGWITTAQVSAQGLFVGGEIFLDLPDSDLIWRRIREGTLIGLSVGCNAEATREHVTPNGPVLVKTWRCLEVSLCRTPGNSDARVMNAYEQYGWC